MKDTQKYIKYSIISTLFALTIMFIPSYQAEAAQYHPVDGNGIDIDSIVIDTNLVNGTLYGVGNNFAISAYMSNSNGTTTPYDVNMEFYVNNSNGSTFVNPFAVINLQTLAGTPIAPPDFIVSGATSTLGTYSAIFKTGVDVQTVVQPILVRLRSEIVNGPQTISCNQGSGTYLDGPTITAYSADFYESIADYNANIPMDVTGRNLKLKINYWSASGSMGLMGGWGTYIPNTTTYTPILSGTSSYVYGTPPNSGLWTENYIPGQFVPEDCEYFWQGETADLDILDGSTETVPYLVIPGSAPSITLNAPAGVYTGQTFSLDWNVTGATSCSAINFSTSGLMSGGTTETMNGTISYTLICSNTLGTSTVTRTVNDLGVYTPPPSCNAYPGNAIQCLPPSYCAADPMNPGYEVCQP